jgi:MFS superfamily sulfate permease-like transporter
MASAVLVGVNPVYGLYASMAGPVGGGLGVSTRLMVVTTTTAAALAAGSALGDFSGADRPDALFVLTAVAGVAPDLLEQLKKGRRVDLENTVTVVPASDTILESTQAALDDAEAWLTVHAPA